MTLPPERIGDKGQRFIVETCGYPAPGWQRAGYAGTREAADNMASAFAMAPGCTETRVVDRSPSGPEPYRPSNSTEGEAFMARWCYCCTGFGAFDDPDPCPILADAMAGDSPDQWRQDGPAGPRCTAWRESPDDPAPLDPAAVIRPLL